MASSDAGTSQGSEYQVFLSFRGPDTRKGFTDVLFHSLTDAGICVFRDDEELRVGERIDGSLQRAIDNSEIYIPIFSRNYASSKWCLLELTRSLANTSQSQDNKEILPIFFDVKSDDVKLKTALYRDAILSLQREKELSNEEVDAWRKALKEVGAIKGWGVNMYKGHGELIKSVTEEVLKKLKTKHRLVTKYLVGIDDRAEALSKWLDVNFDDVRLVQIHGMGGIGKTTLAKVVFNQFCSHFGKCCCFLEHVRVKSSRADGLVELQKKLLSDIGLPTRARSIDEIDYGMRRIGEVLRNKKVLIVLDDVDSIEQVEKLVGMGTLYPGSRILITTRNKGVLQIHRSKCRTLDYEMEVMSTNHALELFKKHAFNGDSPSDEYDDLSREIVSALRGLPLALEVIGSFLFQKKTQEQWEKTLTELRLAPHSDVFKTLKIAYDALTFRQQQIFLDIACFFTSEDVTNATYMWEDCKFLPYTGIEVLISRSLVKITENNKFWMHDQLIDLGREIVLRENPTNPGDRSRIWIDEEVLDAIRTKEMKRNVQALYLNLYKSYLEDVIESEEIGRFEHLRYLKLKFGTFVGNFADRLTALRWICWNGPPTTAKPVNMHLKNVVILELSDNELIDDSNLQSLIKMARKMKVLSLSYSPNITRTPDFSGCSSLERLSFRWCPNLRKIDGCIGKLKCLIDLTIYDCKIEDLPEEIGGLVNLQQFSVHFCPVKKLPDSIWKLKALRKLILRSFPHFATISWNLPDAIANLQKLEVLQVNNLSLEGQLPSGIGSLPFLRILNLSETRVSEVPKTVSMLSHLERLELRECDEIRELPVLPTSLTHLAVSSKSLRVVPDLSNLTNLVELDLNDGGGGGEELSSGEPWSIGRLSKLIKLSFGLHNAPAFAELASLPLLNEVKLSGLDLHTLSQLPLSLKKLSLDNFSSIGSLSPNMRNLSYLMLFDSPMLEFQLHGLQLPNVTELHISECGLLRRFKLSSMRKLKVVEVFKCQMLGEIQFSSFESLEELSIAWCDLFGKLVDVGEAGHDSKESADELIGCEGSLILPSRALNKLRSFQLNGSYVIRKIQVVGTSESWEIFDLWYCRFAQILGGLSNLKNLRELSLFNNEELRVVEGLNELEFLDELQVDGCISLESLIDVSSTKLPYTCDIRISGRGEDFRGSLLSYKHHKVNMTQLALSVSLSLSLLSHITHYGNQFCDLNRNRRATSNRNRNKNRKATSNGNRNRNRKDTSNGNRNRNRVGEATSNRNRNWSRGEGTKAEEKAGEIVFPMPELQQIVMFDVGPHQCTFPVSSDEGTSLGSEYQVFLSFRGPDTRVGFTDVLYHSLTDAGICVFRDDEELRVDERIDQSLLRAIDNSRIYIPIFSRTYALSQWCLRELAQIVANTFKSKGNKEILPIFFDVEPHDVKLKTPLDRDAILNLEHEKKLSNEQEDVWREALMEVDAIKGWEVKKHKG
ncbi:disease resistance protein L6-like [Rhodamnia argentea]|uniref:Disease resistance protein L6-like n=1 Tax=Rhodamnia argentea TaxID=178133 RepID=A0ABM3HW37_9MYRT|nr:disease resistance protein L6-like [Rhodamnia argentea]